MRPLSSTLIHREARIHYLLWEAYHGHNKRYLAACDAGPGGETVAWRAKADLWDAAGRPGR